jgi:phage gp29-like protein
MLNVFKNALKGVKKELASRLGKPVMLRTNAIGGAFRGFDVYRVTKAVESGNLGELSAFYEAALDRDLRVGGDIKELRERCLALEAEITPADPDNTKSAEIANFAREYLFKRVSFNNLLLDLSSAAAYGFACLDLVWDLIDINGKQYFAPVKFNFVEQKHFNLDEKRALFIRNGGEKIYVADDDPKFLLHYHKSASGDITKCGVLRGVLTAVAAKHFVIAQYMQYAELLGVPPIIAQTTASDPDSINALLDQVLSLRSGSAGVFGREDLITLFNGGANPEFFMRFISYMDSEISHRILGGFSANGTESGNRAKETVADLKSDRSAQSAAFFFGDTINALLRRVIDFNFDEAIYPEFAFVFADNYDSSVGLQRIQSMGLPLSKASLYERFKLTPPKDDEDTLAPISPYSAQGTEMNGLRDARPAASLPLSRNFITNNAAFPQDEIDKYAEFGDFSVEEQEIYEALDNIVKNCKTYREIEEAISEAIYAATDASRPSVTPNLSFAALEARLKKYLANSAILGVAEGE